MTYLGRGKKHCDGVLQNTDQDNAPATPTAPPSPPPPLPSPRPHDACASHETLARPPEHLNLPPQFLLTLASPLLLSDPPSSSRNSGATTPSPKCSPVKVHGYTRGLNLGALFLRFGRPMDSLFLPTLTPPPSPTCCEAASDATPPPSPTPSSTYFGSNPSNSSSSSTPPSPPP
ncbi:unnamed protein product [Closterium sp. NIES-53]